MNKALLITDNTSSELPIGLRRNGLFIKQTSFTNSRKHVASSSVDIILIECWSNFQQALAILREVKSLQPSTPVIFLSRPTSEEMIIEAFQQGARNFFKIPYDILEVNEVVKNLLHIIKTQRNDKRTPYLPTESKLQAYATNARDTIPDPILRAVCYFDDKLAEDITLDALSQMACMSKYHFCRLFKKHLQLTPMQFLKRLRVDYARALLQDSTIPITCVAAETGFRDHSSFNRCFKKLVGLSPSEFRRSAKSR